MKITDLEIDGYGVWSGLRIERLSDALNVFYGPNEAGKTTLLAVHPLDALRLLAPAAAISAAGPRRPARRNGRRGRPARPLPDRPLRRSPRRRHARRATHAHRSRRHAAGRAFHQGAAVERRRAGVQQRVRRRPARDSGAGHAERHRGRRAALQPHGRTGSRVAGRGVAGIGSLAESHPRRRRRAVPGAFNCWPNAKSCGRKSRNSRAINRRYGHLAAERDQLHREVVARWRKRANRRGAACAA